MTPPPGDPISFRSKISTLATEPTLRYLLEAQRPNVLLSLMLSLWPRAEPHAYAERTLLASGQTGQRTGS